MKVKLGDYIKIIQGFAFKSKYYVKESNWRLVTLGNFQEGGNCFKYNDSKATYYGGNFPDKVKLKEGDLVLPLTEQVVGLFGNSAFIPKADRFQFVLNQRVGKVELLNDKIDIFYLHYLLATPSVKKQLEVKASGTKQRNISPDDVYDVSVDLPDINIQKNIGKFLFSIEIKKQNNNKINEELEKIIKIIYNYWFLQFDFPNEEGKPYKSSNGEMTYNKELKMEIPKDWKVENLKACSLCSYIKPGVEYFESKVYLPTANVNDEIITQGPNITFKNREKRANMQPKEFSVWFSKIKNSVKHISVPDNSEWFTKNYILSTGFQGLQCTKDSFAYMHCVINSSWFEIHKNTLSHGVTQEGVNGEDLKNIKFVIPKQKLLEKFNKICMPILELKFNNIKENQELTALQDFVLPLLINGQATIKETVI